MQTDQDHECDHCGIVFNDHEELVAHLEWDHGYSTIDSRRQAASDDGSDEIDGGESDGGGQSIREQFVDFAFGTLSAWAVVEIPWLSFGWYITIIAAVVLVLGLTRWL